MKTRIIMILVASAILISLGATRVSKTQTKKGELQAATKTTAPIGGLGSEDH